MKAPDQSCPGSGLRLVSRTYTIRPVTDADREQYERFIGYATERGDQEDADYYRSVIPKWESEVGKEREALLLDMRPDIARANASRDGAEASAMGYGAAVVGAGVADSQGDQSAERRARSSLACAGTGLT